MTRKWPENGYREQPYYVNDENKERYNKDDNKVENEVEKRDKEDKR